MRTVLAVTAACALHSTCVTAQGVTCPEVGGTQFTGTSDYIGQGPKAAPLRGNVGCVDLGPLATRPTGQAGSTTLTANNIYGPMEAGFDSSRPGVSCLGDYVLAAGVDTNLAEAIMAYECAQRGGAIQGTLLDYCGGHANPFHYHERASCLYTADPDTQHSTRVGTALDGNGIYGHNIASGCEPTDLDWCGGRTGVTPDSNGADVYYYVITNRAPFSLACFGPVTSEQQCRDLYSTCDNVTVTFTTEHGSDEYDLDCPCFDPVTGSNVAGATRKPRFLATGGFEHFSCPDCTDEQKALIAAQYASSACTATSAATPAPTSPPTPPPAVTPAPTAPPTPPSTPPPAPPTAPPAPPTQLGAGVTCPEVGGTQFTGTSDYIGQGPKAAPLRGNVGCVDLGPLATRPTGQAGSTTLTANNIYGPMEAGFDSSRPGVSCLGDYVLAAGVDTNLAEATMAYECAQRGGAIQGTLLDYCGGHANPFHYHERASCLYTADPDTQHSTRVGTALDGNGIYGHNIASGCEPTDLDWCGGRTGVTPDSNGADVYYYVITNRAPFSLACFGPVTSEQQCRDLYSTCDNVTVTITTAHGSDEYDLDCPCFDPVTGSNVAGATQKPRFLSAVGFEPFTCPDCTDEQKQRILNQYASLPCGSSSGSPATPCTVCSAAQPCDAAQGQTCVFTSGSSVGCCSTPAAAGVLSPALAVLLAAAVAVVMFAA